jgi:hypothetical protein
MHLRGVLGITQVDFLGPNVIDGGKPILRLAPRINELRELGWIIKTFIEADGTARYVLVPHVEVVEGPVLTTPHEAPALVVGAAGVAGAEWSTESPVLAAPVSGRAPESPPEDFDYIEEGELSWV